MNQDYIEMSGVVESLLPGGKFSVKVIDEEGNENILEAIISGKIRKNFIKIQTGDIVTVDVSLYNPKMGRIKYRKKVTRNKV